MRQKSFPDLITLQCLEKDTQELKTDHSPLTTEIGIYFLNTAFYFTFSPSIMLQDPPPTTKCRGLVLPTMFCFIQSHLSSSTASSWLRKPTPPLLLDLTFLNYTELILRKQNAGTDRHECSLLYEKKRKRSLASLYKLILPYHLSPQPQDVIMY